MKSAAIVVGPTQVGPRRCHPHVGCMLGESGPDVRRQPRPLVVSSNLHTAGRLTPTLTHPHILVGLLYGVLGGQGVCAAYPPFWLRPDGNRSANSSSGNSRRRCAARNEYTDPAGTRWPHNASVSNSFAIRHACTLHAPILGHPPATTAEPLPIVQQRPRFPRPRNLRRRRRPPDRRLGEDPNADSGVQM